MRILLYVLLFSVLSLAGCGHAPNDASQYDRLFARYEAESGTLVLMEAKAETAYNLFAGSSQAVFMECTQEISDDITANYKDGTPMMPKTRAFLKKLDEQTKRKREWSEQLAIRVIVQRKRVAAARAALEAVDAI
jgi:sigma54-dependent transcription regulator